MIFSTCRPSLVVVFLTKWECTRIASGDEITFLFSRGILSGGKRRSPLAVQFALKEIIQMYSSLFHLPPRLAASSKTFIIFFFPLQTERRNDSPESLSEQAAMHSESDALQRLR